MRFRGVLKVVLTIGTACIIVSVLSGCAINRERLNMRRGDARNSAAIYLPKPQSDTQIVLYDGFSNLFVYDTKKQGVVQRSNVENYIQYGFNTPSRYFTAGHSFKLGFKVLRVTPSGIEIVLNLPANTGIFPLATDGKRKFFVMTHYGPSAVQERAVVVSLEADYRLQEFPKTKRGSISGGALLDGRLYFTSYDSRTKAYGLYSLDYSDILAEPLLVEQGLKWGEVFAHAGRIYRSCKNYIFYGDNFFRRASMNHFFDQHGVLIQIYSGRSGVPVLDVVDTASKKVLRRFSQVEGFTFIDNELVVYRHAAIDRVSFVEGR